MTMKKDINGKNNTFYTTALLYITVTIKTACHMYKFIDIPIPFLEKLWALSLHLKPVMMGVAVELRTVMLLGFISESDFHPFWSFVSKF